jgi:hypothetical protein
MVAPIGMPPPSPFAEVMMSGTMPSPSLGILVGEPGAGTADARLHLVEDHERPDLRRQFPDGREVAGRVRAHADLSLDGFDEHGGRVLVDRSLKGVDVTVGDVDDSGDAGGEGFAVGFLRRQREGSHGAAVEGTVDGDDEGASLLPRRGGPS